MRDRLLQLEQVARRLDPEPHQRAEWRRAIDAHVEQFLSQLAQSPAYVPDFGPRDGLLARPFAEEATSIDDALAVLTREVERHGINPASPRTFGYIPGGGLYGHVGDLFGFACLAGLIVILIRSRPGRKTRP